MLPIFAELRSEIRSDSSVVEADNLVSQCRRRVEDAKTLLHVTELVLVGCVALQQQIRQQKRTSRFYCLAFSSYFLFNYLSQRNLALAQDMLVKSMSSDTYEGTCRSNSDGNIRTAGIVGI